MAVQYFSDDKVSVFDAFIMPDHFVVKAKDAVILSTFLMPNSRDRVDITLRDKVRAIQDDFNLNHWNHKGLVLELHDNNGYPIDRIGNMNESDEILWEIPEVVRTHTDAGFRVSMLRRLKRVRSQEYHLEFGMTKYGWFPANEVEVLSERENTSHYGRWSDISTAGHRDENSPLPVNLSSFTTKVENEKVVINWITESELENAGFNIYRSQSIKGPFIKINNKLINGAGTTGKRSEYSYIDTTAKPGIEYYYQIEDVSYNGISEMLATKRLKGVFSAKNRFTTSWANIKYRE